MTRYVHDSFSLLAYLRDEPGGVQVRQLFVNPSHQHWMSVINLGEVFYKTAKEHGDDRAEEIVSNVTDMAIELIEADFYLAMHAARIKARFRMSYADCFAAALAQRIEATVVTGDPEFEAIEQAGELRIEWLTPKPKTRRAR